MISPAYDLLIQSGHVIDPAQGLNGKRDLAIKDGKIAKIAKKIDIKEAKKHFDATGLYVSPGFIDIHTHVYRGGTPLGVNANDMFMHDGVSTLVDAGSAGAGNFLGFKEFIIEHAKPNIFAFLNISYPGIFGFGKDIMIGEAGFLKLLDISSAMKTCQENRDVIVGIKVRAGQHAGDQIGLVALDMALEAATEIDLPVMTHIDLPPPRYIDVINRLRTGDILTHAFRPFPNSPVVKGKLRPELYAARDRGVYLDVGHGMGGFSFKVARVLEKVNFWPDILSSDVHILCINGPAYNLIHVMSKFLCLGMPFEKIIASVTKTPAEAMRRKDLGSLQNGNKADVALYRIEEGEYLYEDADSEKIHGKQRIVVDHVVHHGDLIKIK